MPKFQDYILQEDDNYLFINKPSGISTLADRAESHHLLELAKDYNPSLQACHRLDKETSGVLLFSKNPEAYRHAAILFETRKVKKVYHALVDGKMQHKNHRVSQPIKVSNSGIGIQKDGKEAITLFNTIEIYNQHTWVKCEPETGRTHQLRLHLAFLGHPIVGDKEYGGMPFYLSAIKKNYNLKKWEEERPLLGRVALHAFSLEFESADGKVLSAEAPYPKDINASLKQLRKWNGGQSQ